MRFLEIYLDKNFVNQFTAKSGSYNYDYFDDFKRFWASLRNYQIYTNYSEQELCEEFKRDNVFIKNITIKGRTPVVHYDCDLDSEWGSFIDSPERSPFKLFFLEQVLSVEINKYGYENIQSAEFNKKWVLFYSRRHDKEMLVSSDPDLPEAKKFDSLQKLIHFAHPFHSLIIFDLYVLCDKPNERIHNNLLPILETLIRNNPNTHEIDVLILTKLDNFNTEAKYHEIKNRLNKSFEADRINLTIVLYNKNTKPKKSQNLGIRRLYTNYFEITADKGFNFFTEKQQPGQLQEVKFHFIFSGDRSFFCKKFLKEFKDYIKKVEDKPRIGSQAPRKYIYPHKNNRLIDLETILTNELNDQKRNRQFSN